jgi:hypothetical protein
MQKKLPFGPANYFRKERSVNKLDSESDYSVELVLPNLINAHSVNVEVKCVGHNKYAVVTGEVLDEKHYAKIGYQLSTYKMVKFEELVLIPQNVANLVPTAVLTVSKDNCGNHVDGILRLTWELVSVLVPVEILDCGADD